MKVFSYIINRQEIWLKFKNGILFFYTIYKNGKIKKGIIDNLNAIMTDLQTDKLGGRQLSAGESGRQYRALKFHPSL